VEKMEKTNEELIFKVKNFNSLTKECKRYEAQEVLFRRIAWFFGSIVSYLCIITIVGYWIMKNKSIENYRKSEVCRKAKINLEQQLAFEESYLRKLGEKYQKDYNFYLKTIEEIVMKVRNNPEKYSEKENHVLFAWDKYNLDEQAGRIKPYEEILYYKTIVNLVEQIQFK
jgi:hypothetical protein